MRSAARGSAVGASVDVIIRHHAVRTEAVSPNGEGIEGVVVLRSFSGAQVQRVIRLQGGVELVSECSAGSPEAAFGVGEKVRLSIDPRSVFIATPGAGGMIMEARRPLGFLLITPLGLVLAHWSSSRRS